jgi:hypothetical protein
MPDVVGPNLTVAAAAVYRAGGTDVAVADGGTGASSAATARANLGAAEAILLERGSSTTTRMYNLPGGGLNAVGTRVLQTDRTYYSAFPTPVAVTIDSIILEVTSGAAGSLRVGLYEADQDFQPGDLVVDWGTVDTASNAVKTISPGTPTSIAAGRYVIAVSCSASITVRINRGHSYIGIQPTMGGAGYIAMGLVTGGGGGGALPDPGPGWDAWQTGGFGGETVAILRYT